MRAGAPELVGISGISAEGQNCPAETTKNAWFVAGVLAGVAWPLVLKGLLEQGEQRSTGTDA
jgi:hypothetical protein